MKINTLRWLLWLLVFAFMSISNAMAQDEQYTILVQRFQNQRTRILQTAAESPLTKKALKNFKSLSYFDVSPAYRITAKFTPILNAKAFEAETFFDNPKVPLVERGTLNFSLNGKDYSLKVYQRDQIVKGKTKIASSYAFVPFLDATNGGETFSGGRYVDLSKTLTENVTLDFNLAYTPDCAYNKKFVCPVPPATNRVDARIEAGEKIYAEGLDPKAKK